MDLMKMCFPESIKISLCILFENFDTNRVLSPS